MSRPRHIKARAQLPKAVFAKPCSGDRPSPPRTQRVSPRLHKSALVLSSSQPSTPQVGPGLVSESALDSTNRPWSCLRVSPRLHKTALGLSSSSTTPRVNPRTSSLRRLHESALAHHRSGDSMSQPSHIIAAPYPQHSGRPMVASHWPFRGLIHRKVKASLLAPHHRIIALSRKPTSTAPPLTR